MNSFETSIITDDITENRRGQNTPETADVSSSFNYPHRHCFCMQPLILIIRQTTFTTFMTKPAQAVADNPSSILSENEPVQTAA